jgi:topoisomerase-4 subunit A
LKREVTREDIIRLTEKPVRRIYKLDIDELNDQIKASGSRDQAGKA